MNRLATKEVGAMLKKLFWMLREPAEFFDSIRGEGFREPFSFLLFVGAVIAIFTPIVNYLGWPSTDSTSAFQAQILAWRITDAYLLPRLGGWAYLVEFFLIVVFALLLAAVLSAFIHVIFRLLGGQGPLLNSWKAVCYGVGPCILLGWIPYWSLFVGAWSLILQFYFAPKVLYRMREGRALFVLAFFVGSTFLEFATRGTTVGFGN
jgi:hypothetical protein